MWHYDYDTLNLKSNYNVFGKVTEQLHPWKQRHWWPHFSAYEVRIISLFDTAPPRQSPTITTATSVGALGFNSAGSYDLSLLLSFTRIAQKITTFCLFCHVKNLLQLYCLSVMLSSSYSSFSSTHVSCDNYASFRNNCVSDDCFIFCLFYTMVHLKHLHLVDLQGSYTLSNGECV